VKPNLRVVTLNVVAPSARTENTLLFTHPQTAMTKTDFNAIFNEKATLCFFTCNKTPNDIIAVAAKHAPIR
jgi:hypothetical protein